MQRSLRYFTFALVLAIVLAACQPVQAPGQASGPQNYTLGVVLPFTGSLGSFGTDFGKGVELAVEQMNTHLAAAGSNVQFTIAKADTEGTPDGAAKAVQAVVQTSGAQVVIGPLTTGEVLGAKQFADDNKIVLVAPASSAPAGAIADDFIFRVMYPPDTFAAQAFVKIAAARAYKNVVLLQVDDPFGNGMAEIFSQAIEAAGGKVAVVKYAPEPTDLSSEVTKVSSEVANVQESGATAVFCICFLGDAQKALQAALLYQNLRSVDWLGAENLVNEEILKDAEHAKFLAETHFTVVTTTERQTPNSQPFQDTFKAKFSSEPGPFTNYAYDAANIAMLSILSTGNKGESVQKILPFIANHYIGTAVQTYLDANGDQAIAYYSVAQVKEDGSAFDTIGSFDGSTGEVTLK
jgi:branched-chain amino acid transport system substrate-binding protein